MMPFSTSKCVISGDRTLMSTCEVNALGIRSRYYAAIGTDDVSIESGLSVQATE